MLQKTVSILLLSILFTTIKAYDWPECKGPVYIQPSLDKGIIFPNVHTAPPINKDTVCNVTLLPLAGTVLRMVVIPRNVSQDVVRFEEDTTPVNPLGIVGSAINSIYSPYYTNYLTINGSNQENSDNFFQIYASLLKVDYTSNIQKVPSGQYIFYDYTQIKNDTSMTFLRDDGHDLIIFVTYWTNQYITTNDYIMNDRLSFFWLTNGFATGNKVDYNYGVLETGYPNITAFWTPEAAFRASLFMYSHNKAGGEVYWYRYIAGTWTVDNYHLGDHDVNRVFVFNRLTNLNTFGNIENVQLSGSLNGALLVYRGVVEKYTNGTIVGDLVARFEKNQTKKLDYYPDLVYSFIVTEGSATFNLTEIPNNNYKYSTTSSSTTSSTPTSSATSTTVATSTNLSACQYHILSVLFMSFLTMYALF